MMTTTSTDRHPEPAQRLLQLWLGYSDLHSAVVAWSSYDPALAGRPPDELPTAPPYPTAMAAIRDGWRLIQFSPAIPPVPGAEFRTSFLPNEVLLEKTEINHVR